MPKFDIQTSQALLQTMETPTGADNIAKGML